MSDKPILDKSLDDILKEAWKKEFVTPDQLVKLTKALIFLLGGANTKTDKKLTDTLKEISALKNTDSRMEVDYTASVKKTRDDLMKIMSNAISTATKEWKKQLNSVEARIPSATDLTEIEARIANIKQISVDDIVGEFPRFGAQIRDALELLSGDERLEPSAIKGLEEWMNQVNLASSKGGVQFVGGGSGLHIYVNGTKWGLLKTVNFIPGTGMTISPVRNGNRLDLTFSATGASTANIAMQAITASQSGSDITLDLTTLPHTATGVLIVTRQGQVVVPGTNPGDGTSAWHLSGTTITVYNADASEVFLVQYTY